jgi:hypothetical protein
MQQTLLSRMESLLNEKGTNYTVFLRSYSTDIAAAQSTQEIVQSMIGAGFTHQTSLTNNDLHRGL